MPLKISTQNVHTYRKRIQRDGLKGSAYMEQRHARESVTVTASSDYQAICQRVLGPDSGTSTLDSYLQWDNVSALLIVELLYAIEIA